MAVTATPDGEAPRPRTGRAPQGGDASAERPGPPSGVEALLQTVVLETARVAGERLGEPAGAALAVEVGRRVSEALASLGPESLPGAPDAPPAEAGKPPALAAGAGAAPRPVDLAAAARRAAHDLNQPLTVILGYAALLKRTDSEALRAEAAEQIIKEARKMSGIIANLSRLAKGLDAA